MEAVGAVASIVGLAQAGLGLAKALNEYVGAVSDANDDIAVIAEDIYATYRHLNDLAWVLKQNETTKCMTEDAVTSAQTCAKKAEVLVQKLRKLLVKGGGSSLNASNIQPDDIDITKFRRGIWYIYKSEFELRQAQLHSIKTDISMVYLGYLAMSGASANERTQATEEMELLFNRQTALNRGIQKARQKRDRDARQSGGRRPASDLGPHYSDEEKTHDNVNGPEVVYDTVKDVYKEFDNWLSKRQKSDAEKAAALKRTQDEAVAQYLKEKKQAENKVTTDINKLRKVLDAQGVPPGRVDLIVKAAYPETHTLPASILNDTKSSLQLPGKSNASRNKNPTRKLSWFHRSRKPQMDEACSISESVPDVLKDATLPGGLAQLKALYFQKINIAPGWTEIAKLDVAVPDYRLIPKLLSSQSQKLDSGIITPFLHGFAEVPEDYRYHIVKELNNEIFDDGASWTVLQIEPVKARQSRMKFSQRGKNHVVGIYVILRKVWPPDDFFSMGASTSGELRVNKPLQAMPQDPTFTSKTNVEEPAVDSVTNLDYIPEKAKTYVARTKSVENQPELFYASNLGQIPNDTRPGAQQRSSSPRHVSFADDDMLTEPYRSRSRVRSVERSRYANSSDESEYAEATPWAYGSRSKSRRTSVAPSIHAQSTYPGHGYASDNEWEDGPQLVRPMSVGRGRGSQSGKPVIIPTARGGEAYLHPASRYRRAPESGGYLTENHSGVLSGRHSQATGRVPPPPPPTTPPRSRGRSHSRERSHHYDRRAHLGSSGDDSWYDSAHRRRRRSRRQTSPYRQTHTSPDGVRRMNERQFEEMRHLREDAIRKKQERQMMLGRDANVGPAYSSRPYSQPYMSVEPACIDVNSLERRKMSSMSRSESRLTAPPVYHYGARTRTRWGHQENDSPKEIALEPAISSPIRLETDIISVASSEDAEYVSTARPKTNSKEAVRSILESWTNKTAPIRISKAVEAEADDMLPTGPLSRRTPFVVEVKATTAEGQIMDPDPSHIKEPRVESKDEVDSDKGEASQVNGDGNSVCDH